MKNSGLKIKNVEIAVIFKQISNKYYLCEIGVKVAHSLRKFFLTLGRNFGKISDTVRIILKKCRRKSDSSLGNVGEISEFCIRILDKL